MKLAEKIVMERTKDMRFNRGKFLQTFESIFTNTNSPFNLSMPPRVVFIKRTNMDSRFKIDDGLDGFVFAETRGDDIKIIVSEFYFEEAIRTLMDEGFSIYRQREEDITCVSLIRLSHIKIYDSCGSYSLKRITENEWL